jgi:hypothetical protein
MVRSECSESSNKRRLATCPRYPHLGAVLRCRKADNDVAEDNPSLCAFHLELESLVASQAFTVYLRQRRSE